MLILSVVISAGSIVLLRHAWVDMRAMPRSVHAEHGLVVATGLCVISSAGIITGVGSILDDRAYQMIGMFIVRGALLASVLYLLIRNPRARR